MSINVLQISSATNWRGGEQQLLYLAEEISNLDQVHLAVLCPETSVLKKKLIEKKIPTWSFKKNWFFYFNFSLQIKKICKRQKIDCVHIHDAHSHNAAILSAIFFRNHTPLILSRKVDFPIKKNWFSKYKYNHPKIKSILCVSDAVKKIIEQDISNKAIEIITIYDGVDTTRFSKNTYGYLRNKFKISAEQLLIGNIAAIAPHKDYYTFVNTVEILIRNGTNAKFVIIGDGPERTVIEEYISSKSLQNHIILTGFIDNIEEVLPELDVLLFTSKTEGLGSSILDAYLSKVPVVATNAGGIPEIVKDGETGLLANVGDAEKLAYHVLSIVQNKELREKLVFNASKFVLLFSKQNNALKTLNCYLKIINKQEINP